jgi:diguanylate cyclase (GGDEF)-like protein
LSARELPGVAAMSIVGSFASGSLAIVTVELLRANAPAAALLLIPATFCGLALRAYGAERRRHAHVEFLYRSMSAMQSAPEFRAAIRELLEAARTMLSAEFAEIILLPEDGGDGGLRSSLGPAGDELVRIAPLSEEDDLAVKITSRQEGAIVLARGRSPHVLDAYLAQNGLADGILTALRRDNRIFGVLLVGDRVGDVSTFNDDDRKLFDTFASHTGVLIENERVKEQLRHQAFHDDLTGLPNRVLFTERLRQSLARSAETGVSPTVLLLDLDDFKTINDSLGHSAGDKLLVEVAQRVRTCIRTDDLAARLGGDEFGILLPHAADGVAELLSARLVEALRAPFALYGREMYIHASVGIATEGADARTADEVLANADLAMYSAKSNGKRRYALYEPQMHRRVRRRHELVAALEHAVSRNEITVYYQPVVALATGRTVAFEALVRWMHPHRGLVLPGAFVPLAEETGLMVPIGRKVLEEACRQAREWQQAFPAHAGLSMCVNLSPSELQSRHLADEIVEVLDGTGLASENLIVEITESGAMHDEVAALATLSEIRGRGVRLALDDFGTGHSSLSHLRDFPIDILKIAKPFVDRLGNAPEDTTFIDAIIRLASALELEVVAEGIERPDQEEMLRLLDCSLGQGYHFARPLDATAAELHLATSAPLTPAIPATPDRARSHIRAA